MTYSQTQLSALAWAIDAEGISHFEAEALSLVQTARDAGVTTPLLDVVVDRSVVAPVRERAFGKVVFALAHTACTPGRDWALAN